jgi:hypothetical protein
MTTFNVNSGRRMDPTEEQTGEGRTGELSDTVRRQATEQPETAEGDAGVTRLRDITPDRPDQTGGPFRPFQSFPGGESRPVPPPLPGGLPTPPSPPGPRGLRAGGGGASLPGARGADDALPSDTRALSADSERFTFVAAGIRFAVVDFVARQSFSRLFKVDLNLALEELYPLDEVLGAGGVLIMELGEGERYFNGIVKRFEQTGTRGRYRLSGRAWCPRCGC